jgi:hypothetical protein
MTTLQETLNLPQDAAGQSWLDRLVSLFYLMNTREVSQTLFRQIVLSLEWADADCTSLTLEADDLREIRLCAESHDVAQFARYARPRVVIPANETSAAAGSERNTHE